MAEEVRAEMPTMQAKCNDSRGGRKATARRNRKRPVKWRRVKKRIWRHHIPLALLTAISVAIVYWVVEADVMFRLSMSTAYVGLALLAATLVIGALSVTIRQRRRPISSDITRDIGIWAAIVSLAHVVFGLQRHFTGRMWLYFVTDKLEFPVIRLGTFGIANYAGLIATIIVALLFATSNDWSLRRLGTRKWKRLQRWNYGLFALVALHSIMYQITETRTLPYVYVFAVMVIATMVIQLMGFRQYRRQLHKPVEIS